MGIGVEKNGRRFRLVAVGREQVAGEQGLVSPAEKSAVSGSVAGKADNFQTAPDVAENIAGFKPAVDLWWLVPETKASDGFRDSANAAGSAVAPAAGDVIAVSGGRVDPAACPGLNRRYVESVIDVTVSQEDGPDFADAVIDFGEVSLQAGNGAEKAGIDQVDSFAVVENVEIDEATEQRVAGKVLGHRWHADED